jgi:hypothetical protein
MVTLRQCVKQLLFRFSCLSSFVEQCAYKRRRLCGTKRLWSFPYLGTTHWLHHIHIFRGWLTQLVITRANTPLVPHRRTMCKNASLRRMGIWLYRLRSTLMAVTIFTPLTLILASHWFGALRFVATPCSSQDSRDYRPVYHTLGVSCSNCAHSR